MLQRRGLSAIYSDGHGSFLSGGFFNVKLLLSQARPSGGSSKSSSVSPRQPRGFRPFSTGGAEDHGSPSMFVNEGQPHRHPSRLDHQQRFPGNNLGRFESGSTDTAVPGGSGRRRGGGGFDSPSPPIGFFLFGDDGGSSGNKGRGNMSSVGVIQNGDKAVHEASISLAAAHDEDDVESAVRRSDGHGKGERGDGILASPDTRLENASRVLGGAGGARAPHILIAGGNGETVSEQDLEKKGAARDDSAVIEFHFQKTRKVHDPRFQGFGVVKEDKVEDIRTMVDSFTAPALAAALRDRETTLQSCAHLMEKGDLEGLRRALLPFTAVQVAESRREMRRLNLDSEGFTKTHMFIFRKVLQRLPRHVTHLMETRASVMVPLCNVDGVASVLFTKRSSGLRAHSNEVCFPGGKVDMRVDQHIIQTALREMGEEIGIQESSVDVLGVLRCDWAEVASLVGVAVTPVVGFLGNISREQMHPNPDEVSHCFTIPVRYLIQPERWRMEKYKAPEFIGGPYAIWGLTGYILHRLVIDVLQEHVVSE